MANYYYWVKRLNDIVTNHPVSFVIDPEIEGLYVKFDVYRDNIQTIQLVLLFDQETDVGISTQLCSRCIDGWHEHYKYRRYTWLSWIAYVGKRWLRWAKRKRAARVIRRFYYDYVIPKLYNPHTRGEGFKKLETRLIEMNQK